jgi:hypothetical protein
VKLDFVGANPDAKPRGADQTPAVVSYFKGDKADWKTEIPTYSRVIYTDLWPGIDLAYTGAGGRLKYTFVVHPGADPDAIRLAYRGATTVRPTEEGRLAVQTPVGGFEEQAPYVYQEVDGKRTEVAAAYRLEEGASAVEHRFGFSLGAYDPRIPLILDPVILYCGFIGGAGDDIGNELAIDGSGNAYVAGSTSSDETTFPETVGSLDVVYNLGLTDAFVAKLSAAGTTLLYCGYIGGSGDDFVFAMAVDGTGNAYVTGRTDSTEATFPETVGSLDVVHNGGQDGFVAEVNATGTGLVYCTYLGGSGNDLAGGLTIDGAGNAYVVGRTSSTELTFPVTGGSLDGVFNGGVNDGFVCKLNPAGSALVYCGYVGGTGDDQIHDVAVDSTGSIYVVGRTDSTEASFPETVGPDLTYNGGTYDAFVARVNASGSALVFCGYVGGSGIDYPGGVAVDAQGNVYLVGATGSTEATFPVRFGPDTTYNLGTTDGFVAKISPVAIVYYSVGTSATDLKAGSPSITIAAGVATLTVAQPNNVGVGDEIVYGGSTAFISGRFSSTRYAVTTNRGAAPAPAGPVLVTSIKRAFNTLSDAEASSTNGSHLGTADLVTGGFQLNWACYEDGLMDDQVVIDGYTTSASYYIRVFTPVLPNQVAPASGTPARPGRASCCSRYCRGLRPTPSSSRPTT